MFTLKIFEADRSAVAVTPVSADVQRHLEQQFNCWDDSNGLLFVKLEGRKAEEVSSLLRQGGFQFTTETVPAPPGPRRMPLTPAFMKPHQLFAQNPDGDN